MRPTVNIHRKPMDFGGNRTPHRRDYVCNHSQGDGELCFIRLMGREQVENATSAFACSKKNESKAANEALGRA